jgi:hypothetical protein
MPRYDANSGVFADGCHNFRYVFRFVGFTPPRECP